MSRSKAILSDDGTGCVLCSSPTASGGREVITAINKRTSAQQRPRLLRRKEKDPLLQGRSKRKSRATRPELGYAFKTRCGYYQGIEVAKVGNGSSEAIRFKEISGCVTPAQPTLK